MVEYKRKIFEYWDEAKRVCASIFSRGGVPQFSTGLSFLDEVTGGIQKGDIWIIAGRPGSGKTTLAVNMAQAVADNPQNKVLFSSLEMKGWELTLRMFCEMNGIEYLQLITGKQEINPEYADMFQTYLNTINFEIVEYGYVFQSLKKSIEDSFGDKKPDVIFIDFIQLIEWESFGDERVALVSYGRQLQELAKKEDIAIVIVSQLKRPPAAAKMNRPPEISDLYGSGTLEQMAHKVIFVYNAIDEDEKKQCFIKVAKNRQGPRITRPVCFEGKYFRFSDIGSIPVVQEVKEVFGGEVV